jgi:hypothetical protein
MSRVAPLFARYYATAASDAASSISKTLSGATSSAKATVPNYESIAYAHHSP